MDPYSSDGHDGLVEDGKIVNDKTLPILLKMSIASASRCGCYWPIRYDGMGELDTSEKALIKKDTAIQASCLILLNMLVLFMGHLETL